MRQEIEIKVNNLYCDPDYIRPSFLSISIEDGSVSSDLILEKSKDSRICICGNNDWALLASKLLQPIYDEARKIIEKIEDEIYSSDREVNYIVVGTNDKRILDIFFHGECSEVDGIPVLVVEDQADYCSVAYKI